MTRINLFAKISFLVIAIIFSAIPECSSILSDKRLCYDSKCSEPVSLAMTTLPYIAPEKGLLSVPRNTKVTVYSKSAGRRTDLWGIEFNGTRGYLPKSFLKEYKILKKNLTYEVPTESVNSNNDNKDNKDDNVINNINNLNNISLKNEESKLDSISKYSSPSNTNLDASVPTSDGENIKHLTSETENIPPLYDVIDGTTIFEINEATTQSSQFTHTKQVENNIYPAITPTTTQIKLDSPTKLHQKTESKELKVTADDSISNVHIESDKPIAESQSVEKDNINLSTVESELNRKKGNEDSSFFESVHTEEKSDTNSATSESEDKERQDDIYSSILLSEHKEEKNNIDSSILSSEHKEEKNYIDSSILSSEHKEEKNNIDSSILSSEHKEEKNNIDSSNSESEDKEGKDDTDSYMPGLEYKEKKTIVSSTVESGHANDKDNGDSSTIEIKENVKKGKVLESSIPKLKQEKEDVNVFPLTAEAEIKQETEISNVTIGHTIDTHISLVESETQKQVEVESEAKYINDTQVSNKDQTNNVVSEEKHSIGESQQTDGPENLLNVIKSDEIINNGRTEVQHLVVKDNILKEDVQNNVCDHNPFNKDKTCDIDKNVIVQKQPQIILKENNQMNIVNSDVQNDNDIKDVSSSVDVPMELKTVFEDSNEKLHSKNDEQLYSSQNNSDIVPEQIFHEFRSNRNLLYVEEKVMPSTVESEVINVRNSTDDLKTETLPGYENIMSTKDKVLPEMEDKDIIKENILYNKDTDDLKQLEETTSRNTINNMQFSDVCTIDNDCANDGDDVNYGFISQEKESVFEGNIMKMVRVEHTYWVTLLYLSITAITTLVFSLGYYYIENLRRDSQLIAKVNKLEKELLLSTKECLTLDENLKSTKEKLNSIQDESFGSNEMVLSLKVDLEASQNAKAELEDQVNMLEKDLESATEAGLELERMLREVLSSNNEVNPLAQSVEDLQARLNAQQSANESLTNALNIKTQENEVLSAELTAMRKKYEELDTELIRVTENFQIELNKKTKIQEDLNNITEQLEVKIKQLSMDKTSLCKELKIKETEVKDLVEVINQVNSNNLDIERLYEISHIKAEALELLDERDELKIRLSEVEGAHNLLEEHMKVVKEEVSALSEQCKLAEKEKRDAETRLEVISNFFKEKEAQRQKEEALWLQKQGEVMSTVERIHTMQNEIQGYKQQIEVLKREIVDQEREYKSQISALETKAHEQWVMARQNERRLEESKAEAGQLRNRLTLIEKNINDADADTKLHRLEANGETTTSPPLFIGAESSSSPIMFTGSSSVPPPPPPSFMHPSLFPTYLPPPLPSASGLPSYDVGQRPPPLGGRLSSPPPLPLLPPPSGRYENADSPPPLMSPPLLPPFNHRSHPRPFASDHMHPPLPPPPGSILLPPFGTSHSWGEETLPPPRNSGFHPHQREQRARNHKGSLHSSGESLDKSHHSGKV